MKDSHGGTWKVQTSGGKETLELKWDTVNGYANFDITEFTPSSVKLACISSGWDFMRSWKLYSKNLKGGITENTLKAFESKYGNWEVKFYLAGKDDKLS